VARIASTSSRSRCETALRVPHHAAIRYGAP
jgi:hypothetical protein